MRRKNIKQASAKSADRSRVKRDLKKILELNKILTEEEEFGDDGEALVDVGEEIDWLNDTQPERFGRSER